jgi:NAD(P)-dependent dehydrogenase (short-subunit alcohol dehydrogenase family)
VRVNVVSPGNIETPILAENMAGHMPEAEREVYVANIRKYLITRQPIQRQGTVEDLAQAVMFYCSDRSTYVTGTVMAVDGGLVAGGPPRSSGASVASANKG